MAHRIVWATVVTVAGDGTPQSRILHPIREWGGTDLTGWIATSPGSPKADDDPTTPLWLPRHDAAYRYGRHPHLATVTGCRD